MSIDSDLQAELDTSLAGTPGGRVQPMAGRQIGRPRDVDSAETRQRLLDAARRSFARRGYAATTNKVVAAEAGMTAGAIYHYYGSQADLYAAVYAEVESTVFTAFEVAIADTRGLIERFAAMLDASVALFRQDTTYGAFMMSATTDISRHPELIERTHLSRQRMAAFMHRIVVEGCESGDLTASADVQAIEDLLTAVLTGLAGFSNDTQDPVRFAATVEVLKNATRSIVGPRWSGRELGR